MRADAEDMRAACAGDERAFQRLILRHQQAILAYCLRLLRDEGAAQDVAQDVFFTLWKERKKYSEKGKLRNYLFTIARLRCLALLKKARADKRLRAAKAQIVAEPAPSPDATDDAALLKALGRISSEHRDLIVLRHLEGFDLAEIHDITGLRKGTIKSRLHRAMAALREELAHV